MKKLNVLHHYCTDWCVVSCIAASLMLFSTLASATLDASEPAITLQEEQGFEFPYDICLRATDWPERIVGHAKNIETGETRYTEHYYFLDDIDFSYVRYRSYDESVFAKKLLDARRSPLALDYYYQDKRFQRLIMSFNDRQTVYWGSLDVDPGSADKRLCESYRIGGLRENLFNAPRENDAEDGTPLFVVDAGFNNYIVEKWPALVGGDRETMLFATPEKRGGVRMNVSREPLDVCEKKIAAVPAANLQAGMAAVETEQPLVCFKLAASNWVINRVIKPIYLVYGERDKRLYHFYGLTNISSDEGKRQRLLISYRYKQDK